SNQSLGRLFNSKISRRRRNEAKRRKKNKSKRRKRSFLTATSFTEHMTASVGNSDTMNGHRGAQR
ncbi:unnamed protein product, partial [Brassica napus]